MTERGYISSVDREKDLNGSPNTRNRQMKTYDSGNTQVYENKKEIKDAVEYINEQWKLSFETGEFDDFVGCYIEYNDGKRVEMGFGYVLVDGVELSEKEAKKFRLSKINVAAFYYWDGYCSMMGGDFRRLMMEHEELVDVLELLVQSELEQAYRAA